MTRRDALRYVSAIGLACAPTLALHAGEPPPVLPSPEQLEVYRHLWVDPVRASTDGSLYGLYPTPSRGAGTQGSYRIYLPPQYATEPGRRFGVIYWLHGGFGSSRDGAAAIARIDRAIKARVMPPHLVVVPQALPGGWYVDSKDGDRPVEQVVAFDLVQHIDRTYRTATEAAERTVEGMSIGGYGALRLGAKYPRIFGRVSAVAPSILKDMGEEPAERTEDAFSGDQRYYDAVGPWTLTVGNAPALRQRSRIRLLAGGEDTRLVAVLREYAALLTSLGIPHEFIEVPGVGHDYPAIVDGIGGRYAEYWARS